jgi:hypothetical protein
MPTHNFSNLVVHISPVHQLSAFRDASNASFISAIASLRPKKSTIFSKLFRFLNFQTTCTVRYSTLYSTCRQSGPSRLLSKEPAVPEAALHHWGVRVPRNTTRKHTFVQDLTTGSAQHHGTMCLLLECIV